MNRRLSAAAILCTAAFTVAACGGGDDTATEPAATSAPSATSESASPSESPTDDMTEDMDDTMAMPVGPGCADYAAQVPDGDGSITGMSLLPVSQAAAANPILTQLVAAVSGQLNPDVDLVSTIDSDEFTIFAPVDAAFEALPADTLATLQTPEGAETLSTVLQYHVVPGRIEPDAIIGTQTSVNNFPIEVAGTEDALTVNGSTNVICGGVQTANATVYLIDAVLMPPA